MNILSVVAYCSNTCKNDCHLPQSPWNDFIDWLPCIIIIAFLSIIVMFLIKYGVEYNKINKDYLLKTKEERNNQLTELKTELEYIHSTIDQMNNKFTSFEPLEKKFRKDIRSLKKLIGKMGNKNK